jgi:murein DD-endopeptidase MepM/ murein hydrolase activator NlpD
MKLAKSIRLILFSIILLNSRLIAYAETDEDLLEIYGKSSYSEVKQNIETQIVSIENNIKEIERIKKENEEYNNLVDKYNEEQERQYKVINNTVEKYIDRNISIKEEFLSDLESMSISDLKKLDSEFKANIVKMDEVIDTMDNVTYLENYKNTDFDLEGLYLTVDSLWDEWDTAIDATEIGNVKSIQWIMPNEYKVTSKFGYRVDPLSGSKITYHTGADFKCDIGTPVGALFNGVVIDTSYSASSGKYITVQSSDRVKYFYCHLDEVFVDKGDSIKQGDIIANSGNTGYRSTGPHLHLSLYINGAVYDPCKLFE